MSGRRLLLWAVLGIVVVSVLGWALLVPAADSLARHDVGAATGTMLETARNNARNTLLTLAAGLVAAATILFAALNFWLQQTQLQQARDDAVHARADADKAAEVARRTLELAEQGQVTERFTKALELLGSEQLDVRLGAIYALERIMADSARDHLAIVELLAAFVRQHAPSWPPGENEDPDPELGPIATDVLAAVTVLTRRPRDREERRPVNLAGVLLAYGADLPGADLSNMDLSWSNLAGADLREAKLISADLASTNFADADVTGAMAAHADLSRIDLTEEQKNSLRSM